MGLLSFTEWSEKAFLWQQTMKRVLKKDGRSHCALPKCLFQESRGCKDPGVGRCSKRGTERPSPMDVRGKERGDVILSTYRQQTMEQLLCQHRRVAMLTKPSVLTLYSLLPWGNQNSCWVVFSFMCLIKLWLSFEDHKPKWRLYTKACRKQNNERK